MQLSMSQIIECYLHATQNEIDIDKSLSKSITKKMPPLPRTSKWAGERWSSSSLQIIYAVIMFAFLTIPRPQNPAGVPCRALF